MNTDYTPRFSFSQDFDVPEPRNPRERRHEDHEVDRAQRRDHGWNGPVSER